MHHGWRHYPYQHRLTSAISGRVLSDPDNATKWYVNIKSVIWKTPKPVVVGSQIDFVAHFMGKKLSYTYEVIEKSPTKFVMRTAQGPVPMETLMNGKTWEIKLPAWPCATAAIHRASQNCLPPSCPWWCTGQTAKTWYCWKRFWRGDGRVSISSNWKQRQQNFKRYAD